MFGKGGENDTTRTFFLGKNNYPVQDYHVFQIWKEGNRQRTEFKLVAEGILKGHADAFAPQCPLK